MSRLIINEYYSHFEYITIKRDTIGDIYYRGYLRFKDVDEEKAKRYFDKYWQRKMYRISERNNNVCFLDGLNHTKTTLGKEEFECQMYHLLLAATKFVKRYEKYIPQLEKTMQTVNQRLLDARNRKLSK